MTVDAKTAAAVQRLIANAIEFARRTAYGASDYSRQYRAAISSLRQQQRDLAAPHMAGAMPVVDRVILALDCEMAVIGIIDEAVA